MKNLLFVLLLLPFTSSADEQVSLFASPRQELLEECSSNKLYGKLKYKVKCDLGYHHYNPDSTVKSKKKYNRAKAINNKSIKISEFNVLHPGMDKTRFKDFKKVAQIMNNFDIIGVTELISLTQADLKNNNNVIDFIKSTPAELVRISKRIKSLKQSIAHTTRSTVSKRRELYLLERQKEKLEMDLPDAIDVYRVPGYLQILNELHKLRGGSEWSLILSPQGEGSEATTSPELVGYYYKSSIIKPKINKYCKERKRGKSTPVACILEMDAKDFDEDKRDVISRRPFLAEFQSGKFSFTLITSHILFEEPKDKDLQKRILRKAFKVENYKELGPGASRDKYARLAEVKLALEFIQRNLQGRGHQKDIIYMGDLNLEIGNKFWPKVLNEWDDSKIFIDQKTSLKKGRYNSDGSQSFGKSSNYDHFIFNPRETDECIDPQTNNIDGGILDFVTGRYSNYINSIYKVRNEREVTNSFFSMFMSQEYELNKARYNKVRKRFITPKLNSKDPIYTVDKVKITYGRQTKRFNGIKEDDDANEEFEGFVTEKVLKSQLYNKSYYALYAHIVSDHYPIYMKCATN